MSIESRSSQYGSIFGQWHIEKLLGTGSGGKSAVYSIYRDNNGWREYSALKAVCIIEERGSREELSALRRDEYSTAVREQRAHADQEVRLMDQLRGKTNIVDYQDHVFHSWHDDTGFGVDLLIRMEKLTDLRSRLRKGEALSEQEIIRVGRDICQALVVCHSKNILHRDIKPENIFFNQDGDYKLGDFGISRILDSAQSMASTGIGTLPYLAPEQNSGRYDERVDIYSLGLVLYELANFNRLPFADSGYIREVHVRRRLSGEPLPVPQGVSHDLAQIILTACAFRPEDRFQNARAMLTALENTAQGTVSMKTAPLFGQNPSYGTIPADNFSTRSGNTNISGGYVTIPGGFDTVPGQYSESYSTVPVSGSFQTRNRQNSLNPSGNVPAGNGTSGNRKPPNLLPVVLLLAAALIGVLAFLLPRPEESDTGHTPLPKETQSAQAPVQTQKPVQTQPPIQTEPLKQTEPPRQTEAPRPPEPVLVKTTLLDLPPSDIDGNLYVFLSAGSAEDVPYTPHVTVRQVQDNYGNKFDFSIHADGNTAAQRSFSYNLNREYTRFCGQIVFLSFADNIKNNKPVEIYCDGVLKFSAVMSRDSRPVEFDIDVTGVKTLEIVYPQSNGSNDQAAVCDAWLESYVTP